jgi:hypothetical protein
MTTHDLLQRLNNYGLPGEFTEQGDHIDWYYCLDITTEDIKADQSELSEIRRTTAAHIEKHTGHCADVIEDWQDHDSCGFQVILKDVSAAYNEALEKLKAGKCPGIFEIKEDQIQWFYLASYVDATRVEDLITVQDEALQYVIRVLGDFRLKEIGHEHDRCWFKIAVV